MDAQTVGGRPRLGREQEVWTRGQGLCSSTCAMSLEPCGVGAELACIVPIAPVRLA